MKVLPEKLRSVDKQGNRWQKKMSVKVIFALTLIWGVLALFFLHSNFVIDTDIKQRSQPSSLLSKEDQLKKIYLPRLIYLGTAEELIEHRHQMQQQTQQRGIEVDEHSLKRYAYIKNDKNYKQVNFRNREFDEECVAMGSWQECSFPSCNQIHEVGLLDKVTTDEFHYVASGGWNDVFNLLDTSLGLDPSLAMKILSPKRGIKEGQRLADKYKLRNYERVRQDAIILERLSSSKHVMDLVGYCGNVIISPFADGTLEDKINKLVKTKVSIERLKLMVDAAKGLADIHGDDLPSIVHGDLTSKQYMFVNGTLQLGDFNQAILIKRNTTSTDKACQFHRKDAYYGFPFRSPEEYS